MPQKKLLIYHQGALGDFILTFPILSSLKKNFSTIGVICQSQLGKMAILLKLIDAYYPVESKNVSSLYTSEPEPEIINVIKQYDYALLFSNSIILKKQINTILPHCVWHLPLRPPPAQRVHVTKYLYNQLIKLPVYSFKEACLNQSLIHFKKDQPEKKIIIHPGSGSERKCWPMDRFIDLYRYFEKKGFECEMIFGPAELSLLSKNESRLKSDMAIQKIDNLEQLIHLLSSSGTYIGNDSGVTHLAALLSTFTISIFGPSDPVRWMPNGSHVHIIRPRLNCQPCFETTKFNCQDPACLKETKVADVWDVFLKIIKPQKKNRN